MMLGDVLLNYFINNSAAWRVSYFDLFKKYKSHAFIKKKKRILHHES